MSTDLLNRPANGTTASDGKLHLELATDEDDWDLRQLLHSMPMGERVQVKFLREPSFFQAAAIQGHLVQVIVGRRNGRIIGFGTRAIRRCYINGQPQDAGYLADLRLVGEERRGTALVRGYRFLRELHAQDPVLVYSTVIVEDNQRAISTIASGRAGLPTYTPLGRVLTPMIQLTRSRPEHANAGVIHRGDASLLPAIVEKLNENRLQFAPLYSEGDFTSGRFPNFRVHDFYALMRDGNVAAVAGVWDQHAFRQTVVSGYGGWLKRLRPVINLGRRQRLPPAGTELRYFTVSFVACDNAADLAVLMRRIHNDALGGPWSHFTLALHEDDPRAEVLAEFPRDHFAGRLYAVTFDGPADLDDRIPFVDAGLL